MSLPSDTESDSPSTPPPQESFPWKVAPYTQRNPISLEDADISYSRISDSLMILLNQNLPLSEDDASSVKVHIASDKLLQFLAMVPQVFDLGEQTADMFRLLGEIADVTVLQKLLDYRKALRETTPLEYVNEMPSVLITWVDVLLARLVITAPIIVSASSANAHLRKEQGPDWLVARQEDDAARAATQLPDSWACIMSMVGSTHASPAARRLATTLAFFIYVLSPRLKDSDPWSTASVSPLDLMERLYRAVGHAGCYTTSPTNTHFASMERVHAAMLISLFSAAHLKADGMEELAQLRPDGFGHILEMIQIIMRREDTQNFPLDGLDVAQSVLVRWGDFVPWTWSIWNDQRTAKSDVLRWLTATWLYHLNTPLYAPTFDACHQLDLTVDLRSVLLKDVPSSSAMILQVFQETIKNLDSDQVPPSGFRIVLNKVCWSIVQYFECYLAHQRSHLDGQFCQFGRLLLVAAVHSHLREDGYILRDLAIEALILIPAGILDTLTKSVTADKKVLFMTCLDETIRHSLKTPSTHNVADFLIIKSILEVCCVMLSQPSCGDSGLKTAASVYLERVFTLLVQEGPDSTGTSVILGGFLTLLGTLRRHKYAVNILEDELWALITPSSYLDITIPFAQYVFGTLDRPRDPLLTLEAWDHILGTLRTIVDEQLSDEEEPLALLAAPCLCYTLCGISSNNNTSDSTRFYLRSSPWTQTMLLSVGKLLDGEWPDGFRRILQGRLQLRFVGKAFLKEFAMQAPLEEAEPGSGSQSEAWAAQWPRLVYYREASFSGLIPVLDID